MTANIKDFPAGALSEYEIEAVHPDEFLLRQFDLDPRMTLQCLAGPRAAYSRPTLSAEEFYQWLRAVVPQFADRAQALERGTVE